MAQHVAKPRHDVRRNRALTVLALGILVPLLLTGCIGLDEPCGDVSEMKDFDKARSEFSQKWKNATGHQGAPGDEFRWFAIVALRSSPPDPPQPPHGTPKSTTFVDWDDMSRSDRPGVVQDLLCLSQLRRETAPPRFTDGHYTVAFKVHYTAYESAIQALSKEHARQNGEAPPDCCYILYEGEHYETALMQTSHSG